MHKLVALACLTALALASACSPKTPENAEEYYQIANGHLREGAYPLAIENYRDMLDQHPFSDLAEEAELKIGYAHFQDHACPEAIAAFTDFQRRHPTSPHLPMVGYLIGLCNEREMKSPDRDQSASQSAHAYYQAVINQYPESPYADLAQERLLHCRENLADHELLIANFYGSAGNQVAAEVRLVDLVRRYNDTDQAADALYELAEIYKEREAPDKAAPAYAAILYHHPDHNLAKSASAELDAIIGDDDRPAGDPLAALVARSGRSRELDQGPTDPESLAHRKPGNSGRPRLGFNQPPAPTGGLGMPNGGYR